jgi:hypothetical protein
VREGFFIGQLMSDMTFGPELEDYYYEGDKGRYLCRDAHGAWMPITTRDLKLRLAQKGFETEKAKGDLISMADSMILRIQQERYVVYAGPLAGYEIGRHEQGGYNVLVTHQRNVIQPVGVDWDVVKRIFVTPLIDECGYDQSIHLFTWLKRADEALNSPYRGGGSQSFTPGPALVLAGPKDCGKTLMCSVIRKLLGGRVGKPYRYMMGATSFNKELMGSELLVIDDEISNTDLRTRRAFGYQIKNMLFAENQSGHGKAKDAITLYPFCRLMILVNDEPESLLILPPVDDSLDDKIMMLKVCENEESVRADTPAERAELNEVIDEQLPAFLGWLRYGFVVPKECDAPRTGVYAFRHKALMETVNQLTPENKLMTLIDDALFSGNDHEDWQGTANQLSKDLCEGPYKHDARALLNWTNATGTYLGRLAKSHPDRFIYVKGRESRLWRVVAPEKRAEHTDRVVKDPLGLMQESMRRHREKMSEGE